MRPDARSAADDATGTSVPEEDDVAAALAELRQRIAASAVRLPWC